MILTQDPTISGPDVLQVSPTAPLNVIAAHVVIQGPIVIAGGNVVINTAMMETAVDSAKRDASISVIGIGGTTVSYRAPDGADSPFGTSGGDGTPGTPGGNGGTGGSIIIFARQFSNALALSLIADGGVGGRGQDGGNGGLSSGENGAGGLGGQGGNGGVGGTVMVFYRGATPSIKMSAAGGNGGQHGVNGRYNTQIVDDGVYAAPGQCIIEQDSSAI